MKLTILALTTLLTLSTAQVLGSEPVCATACLSSAISKAGCAEADQACQCGPTQASIGAIVATCLLASCPATELAAVQSIGLALCAAYSAALTMTTTAAPATVTSSVGSSSSGGSLPTGSGPVATSTSTTVAASTTILSTTTAPTTSASSAASVSSASSSASSASAKSSGSATTSGPATVSSSAAIALLANGIGGLAALFFGVAATL